MNLAVLNLSLHTPQTHELINIPIETIGDRIVGAPVLTRNIKPPMRPQPEDEMGIGRSPGQEITHARFEIHDNPDWYLGTGAHYDPITSEEFKGRTHVTGQWLNDVLTRRSRRAQQPGSPITTVQAGIAVPNSQLSVL